MDGEVGGSWGSPAMPSGRHEIGVACVLVPQGTKCGIRKVGDKSWRRFTTTKPLLFRSSMNARAGKDRFIFRYEGWQLIVDSKLVERVRGSPDDVLD